MKLRESAYSEQCNHAGKESKDTSANRGNSMTKEGKNFSV